MTTNLFNQSFQKEQVEVLYEGSLASVLATLLFAPVIYFTIAPNLTNIQYPSIWIFLIIGIALLRGVDTFLYYKTAKTNRNTKLFLGRLAIGTTLAALTWGLMLWNYFPASSQENQFYLIAFVMGIASFATTTLSYQLGVISLFMLPLIVPTEIRLLLDSSESSFILSIFIPIFFLAQINGARRINKKYLESIQVQIELKEKEEEYINLKYAIDQHNIVSITDVKGNITYANNKTVQISHYSNDELIGTNHRILNSKEHTPAFWKYLWRTIAGGRVWHGKIKNIDKEGTTYWLDSSIVPFMNEKGKPYQYISISTEITKLKEFELQTISDKNDALVRAEVSHVLQGQNALKERITKSLEVISQDLELDLQDKLGILLAPAGSKRLKLYATQGQYSDTPEAVNKCTTHLQALCARAIYSGRLVISDHCYLDSDQQHSDHTNSHGHYIIPLLHNTKVLGILFIFTAPSPTRSQTRLDTLRFIGNLFGMAIANETIKNNLRQARKHAIEMAQAKSDFLANMSHEIRTPMNGVLGMLDLLKDMPLDTQSKNYVGTAQSSASMLLNVINDILDISKIESGKLHIERIHFDLRKTIENTTELLSKLAHEKDIELLIFIPPDTKTLLEGDMLRLQQVINNLMSNAIKFTHEGEVSVTLSTLEESESEIKIRFDIKDTGIGIPADKQGALFQAFTQADTSTSREYGGTGLGLAISKKLIEMMGGKIGIISEEGKGSTFWFELPFTIVSKESVSYNNLDKLRILTIDDNETNCMILEKYVESWGAESVVSTTAESGISLLLEANEQGQPFDTLLLDMQMPDTTGQDVATEIRKHSALEKLKIILLSSMGLEKDMNTDGLYDLMLNKPIRQSQLYDAITTIQNKSLAPDSTDNKKPSEKKPTSENKRVDHPLKGNILFVDDSKVNQYVGNEFLTKLELNYEIAINGQEALTRRKEGNFDLILMDCQMPVMDGYEATRKIREYEKETGCDAITIIALTANAMQGDREKCIETGMDDYLAKPYTIDTLYQSLSSWLPEKETVEQEIIENEQGHLEEEV